jgi:protein-S-isoprenylcysteine O-methyltransferase Ste14
MEKSLFLTPLIVFLSVLVYGFVHSLLAALGFKRIIRRLFGPHTDRWYRIVYNLLAVIGFLPVLGIMAFLPAVTLYVIPPPWIYLTTLGQLAALGLLVIGLLQTGVWSFLGLRQLVVGPDQAESKLVVKGLYRYVRHPLYTAGLLFIWLTPVMTNNVLALNLALTIYIILGAYHEENRLAQEFNGVYESYKRDTPMLVPFVRWVRD